MIMNAKIAPASADDAGIGRSTGIAMSTTKSAMPDTATVRATAEISSNEPNTHRPRYRPRAMPATSCASATAGNNNASRPAWM